MAFTPRIRHLRHQDYDRVRRRDKTIAFLVARATALAGTGAAKVFTATPTFAVATLTLGATPLNNSTVTVNGTVYTFKTTLSAGPAVPYEVLIGAAATNSLDNLVAAINGAAGAGTTYGTGTVAHTTVGATKASASTMTATARFGGTDQNAYPVVTNVVTGSWGTATLTGGAVTSTLASTTHGLLNNTGPYEVSTSGVLPAGGLLAGTEYWTVAVAASTLALATKLGASATPFTTAGTGTHTLTKAASARAIFETIRKNGSRVVSDATDVDNL